MGSFLQQFTSNLQNPAMLGVGLKDLGSLFSGSKSSGNPSGNAVPMAMPHITLPQASQPQQVQNAVNNSAAVPVATQANPSVSTINPTSVNPYSFTSNPGSVGTANDVPIGNIKGGDFNSVYGVDTGTALTNLFNSENSSSANSIAQAIINANAPNVAQGQANLNTQLAASGISPSSSVSAIENANFGAQVQQQNLSELAQVNLSEQQMQQQLLESLLPSEQQRQTDSSGWSIFGDILSGIGDVVSL